MKKAISITGIHSISPLGVTLDDVWKSYRNDNHCFTEKDDALVAALSPTLKKDIEELRVSDTKYKTLDNTTLYAIWASRKVIETTHWKPSDNFGINIGSSRGATEMFEQHFEAYLKNKKVNPLTSPNTTLGNISSWIAHDLNTQGPEISHSITCSSALHAMLNGIAWIQSGMSDKFLVGGSEAPLTDFTIAQMRALKIYNKNKADKYPCRPLDFDKKRNTMILGEGASMACLENGVSKNAMAKITGIGYATEILKHHASLSTNADCFQRSMKMALGTINPNTIDIIITHMPGTLKGDLAEFNAIRKIFGKNLPSLTNNKWKIGHTLGASGMLNVEMALLMLKHQEFISIPYLKSQLPENINRILVNAVGFGGNAVSIILEKP